MAKPITDIPGAANQQLRSLKKTIQGSKFTSKLEDPKNKQLSEEIVTEVLSELEGTDEFTLQLQNKIVDIILGRITYQKAETDISQADLSQLKSELVESLQNSTSLAENIKQEASKCASLALDSAKPSDNSEEVIGKLKELSDTIKENGEEQDKAKNEDDGNSSNIENEQVNAEISENAADLRSTLGKQFEKIGNFTTNFAGVVVDPIKNISDAVSNTKNKISNSISSSFKKMSGQIKNIKDGISTPFRTLGKNFSDMAALAKQKMEDFTKLMSDKVAILKNNIKEALSAPFRSIGNFISSLNPFKKKKKNKLDDRIIKTIGKIVDFIKKFDEKFIEFLDKNIKKITKLLKKRIRALVDDITKSFMDSFTKFLSKLERKIMIFMVKASIAVQTALLAALPEIYIIAALITAIGVIVGLVLIKFPKLVKPLIDVIPIIIDFFGQLIEFIITKVWSFFKDMLWPFLHDSVWPFMRYKIWPFFTEKVFPIVEMIVKCIFETIWPFVHEKLWPWLSDIISRIIDFILTKVWPFLKDVLTWVRDKIITPVWEKFVVPLLEWIVQNIIPFVEKYVAPVLATILEILNIFLQAIKPWIKPITTTILQILDWLLDLLYKVLVELEPVILAVADVISTIFVVVFEAIDAIVSPILKWLREQLINLKNLWNAFVETMTGMELLGCRPFKFLDGCKFDVNKPPSGVKPPEPEGGESSKGVSEFIQQLVNGIVNATDIIKDAVKAMVFDQVKKKIKNIFKFLRSQEENELAIDEEAITKKLGSTEAIKAISIAIEKAENVIKQLQQIDKALVALVKDICKVDTQPKVDKAVKKTAETDGSTKVEEKKAEEENSKSDFDMNEFLDELFSDTDDIQSANTDIANNIESTVATAKENAMSFLKDSLMPLLESFSTPLQETVDLLGKPPGQNLEMNTIVNNNNAQEPNQALSDQ